jgi:hypothetical protein
VVLATDQDTSQSTLSWIVVERDAWLFEKMSRTISQRELVVDGFAHLPRTWEAPYPHARLPSRVVA